MVHQWKNSDYSDLQRDLGDKKEEDVFQAIFAEIHTDWQFGSDKSVYTSNG